MSPMLSNAAPLTPREKLDVLRPSAAKVITNREDHPDYRRKVGTAFALAIAEDGLSIKEAAALLHRDAAQVSRWISGAERVQVDALYPHPRLFAKFVIALASDTDELEVTTVVRFVRRTA